MRFEIETYKGQLIEYDDEYDKFICDISIEDKYSTKKRASLNDIRKEIDQFIKLNADFKPFKAIFLRYGDSIEIKEVKSMRTDGKFMVYSLDGKYNSQYSKKDMENCMLYDAEIISKYKKIEAEKTMH